jgi:hypothetical protein
LAASAADAIPDRNEQFRRLANAALATGFYSRPERLDALLTSGRAELVPPTSLRDLLDRPSQFTNPKSKAVSPAFHSPVDTQLPVVVGPNLTVPRHGRHLEPGQWRKLHLHPATLLAATPATLRRVCAGIEARQLAMPKLTDAVVCLQSVREGTLYAGERDLLWRALGVPVYEQWLGLDGELLAHECEAHDGLHFNPALVDLEFDGDRMLVTSYRARRIPTVRLATGWSASVDDSRCPCGNPHPRLQGLRSMPQVDTQPTTHPSVWNVDLAKPDLASYEQAERATEMSADLAATLAALRA